MRHSPLAELAADKMYAAATIEMFTGSPCISRDFSNFAFEILRDSLLGRSESIISSALPDHTALPNSMLSAIDFVAEAVASIGEMAKTLAESEQQSVHISISKKKNASIENIAKYLICIAENL